MPFDVTSRKPTFSLSGLGELTRTAEASSREVDFKHLNILIHPLGKLDPDGTIAWCDDFARHASAVDPRILPPPHPDSSDTAITA